MKLSITIIASLIIIIICLIIFYVYNEYVYNEYAYKEYAYKEYMEESIHLAQIDTETVLTKNNEYIIKDLINGHVNIVALRISNDSGVFWDSNIAPSNGDILKNFINISHKNNLKVWTWMTTLDIPWIYEQHSQWRIKAYKNGEFTTKTGWYNRISPCVKEHREYINNLYYELASKYYIDGILLQDDLYWDRNEGFDDTCKYLFKQEFGTDLDVSILNSPLEDKFYEWRSRQLTEIVKGINISIKRANPDIKLAINIYPDAVIGETDPDYQDYLSYIGQDYTQLSHNSDYVAIMAYHILDEKPIEWIGNVTKQAIKRSNRNKVIIKIQGIDWNTNTKISNDEIRKALMIAKENGAKNFGLYLWNFYMSDFDYMFNESMRH